jgi:hypothetical protein
LSAPNFNTLGLQFELLLAGWGCWGYWKKKAGPKRLIFLAITVLAVIAFGIRSFATGTTGYVTVNGLHWLLMIMLVASLVSVAKYERSSN